MIFPLGSIVIPVGRVNEVLELFTAIFAQSHFCALVLKDNKQNSMIKVNSGLPIPQR